MYVNPNATPGTYPIIINGVDGTSAASTTLTLVIPATQTITFPPIGSQIVGASVTLSATASSDLPATYNSATPSVCGVSGGNVSTRAPGTCTITASQPGNSEYAAATPVSQSFTVLTPTFALATASPTFTLAPGAGGTLAVTVTPVNGFTGNVAFTSSGIPSGASSAFTPTSSTAGTTYVVYASSSTKAGNYTITITGTSGGTVVTTTFTLTIS
jgi:hypothetical protein